MAWMRMSTFGSTGFSGVHSGCYLLDLMAWRAGRREILSGLGWAGSIVASGFHLEFGWLVGTLSAIFHFYSICDQCFFSSTYLVRDGLLKLVFLAMGFKRDRAKWDMLGFWNEQGAFKVKEIEEGRRAYFDTGGTCKVYIGVREVGAWRGEREGREDTWVYVSLGVNAIPSDLHVFGICRSIDLGACSD